MPRKHRSIHLGSIPMHGFRPSPFSATVYCPSWASPHAREAVPEGRPWGRDTFLPADRGFLTGMAWRLARERVPGTGAGSRAHVS